MSETPTNRTPEVVSLPNGTCSVDTDVGRTVFASPAPAPGLLSAERLAAPRLTPTQARKALLNGIIRARIGTKASPIPNNDLQNVVELLTYQEAHVTTQAAALQAAEARAADAEAQVAAQAEQIRLLTIRADSADWAAAELQAEQADQLARCLKVAAQWDLDTDAAEARATEAEAQVAMLKTELAEQERELSYERQMRQQTEEAMIKLADQVKQQTAEKQTFELVLAEARNMAYTNYGAAYEHIADFAANKANPCQCDARSDNECTCHA